MRRAPVARDLIARNGRVTLAGSVWLPRPEPRAGVLMVPGSGPADRHNDVVFPPIRDHLVEHGIVVASFDKRGVGDSSGDWQTAGLDVLAADGLAELDALRALEGVPADRVGLLGHSQGGWVVIEAAATSEQATFVVTHSGPGVSVAEQDRYALRTALAATGATAIEVEAAGALYGEGMDALRRPSSWERFMARLADPRLRSQVALLEQAGYSWPTAQERDFLGLILDHDPAAALGRLDRPVLALFGAADALVPVAPSVEVFERELDGRVPLSIVVFPGADHRMRIGDPPRLVPGYLETISGWILDVASGDGTLR